MVPHASRRCVTRSERGRGRRKGNLARQIVRRGGSCKAGPARTYVPAQWDLTPPLHASPHTGPCELTRPWTRRCQNFLVTDPKLLSPSDHVVSMCAWCDLSGRLTWYCCCKSASARNEPLPASDITQKEPSWVYAHSHVKIVRWCSARTVVRARTLVTGLEAQTGPRSVLQTRLVRPLRHAHQRKYA
jgi:hypothetical protein